MTKAHNRIAKTLTKIKSENIKIKKHYNIIKNILNNTDLKG